MSEEYSCLSGKQKFALGALGGVLPILAGLLVIDLATIIDHREQITPGIITGYCIRTTVLVILGGIISSLNKEVNNSLSLVQLGIAAPALITSYMHGAALEKIVQQPRPAISLTFISSAFAAESKEKNGDLILAQGFYHDTLRGVLQPPAQILRGLSSPEVVLVPETARETGTAPVAELNQNRGYTYAIRNKVTGICIEQPFEVSPREIQTNFPSSIYVVTLGGCIEK